MLATECKTDFSYGFCPREIGIQFFRHSWKMSSVLVDLNCTLGYSPEKSGENIDLTVGKKYREICCTVGFSCCRVSVSGFEAPKK